MLTECVIQMEIPQAKSRLTRSTLAIALVTADRVDLVMLAPEDLQTQDREVVPMLVRAAHVIRGQVVVRTLVPVVPLTLARAVRVMIAQAVRLMRALVDLLMQDLVALVMLDQADHAIHAALAVRKLQCLWANYPHQRGAT